MRLAPSCPAPSEPLPWKRRGWESGRRGGRDKGWASWAHLHRTGQDTRGDGTKRHREPPMANTCQLRGSLPPETSLSQGAGSVFSWPCWLSLVAPGTRVPLDTGDSPTGTWGMGLGQTWLGFPPPAVSKPSTGLLDKELGVVHGDEGSIARLSLQGWDKRSPTPCQGKPGRFC